MSLKGIIVKIEKNEKITLRIKPGDNCGNCKGCLMAYTKKDSSYEGKADCPENSDYKAGDIVYVTPVNKPNEALSSFLLFGLPLIGFLIGLFYADSLFGSVTTDLHRFILAVSLSLVSVIPAMIYSKIQEKSNKGKPDFKIENNISQDQCSHCNK